MTAHADRALDEQPAPTARETAADELAEAERVSQLVRRAARQVVFWRGMWRVAAGKSHMRGRERDAARTELEAASEVAVDLAADAVQLRAEVERLHSALAHESDAHIAERARLRTRIAELKRQDKAAAAVLEEYAMHGLHRLDALADLLDELVRVRREGEQ